VALLLIAFPAAAAEQAGAIKVAKGTVILERGGQRSVAASGAPVFAGDRITTGPDGSVGITLRDNTLLSAGLKSTLIFDRFVFDSTSHAGALDASLKRGSLAVVSGKTAKQSPMAVQFRAPATILGVRGTEFAIEAQREED
jgi:hypothetical protein